MKGNIKKIIGILIVIAVLASSVVIFAEDTTAKNTATHYNVVMVIDGSGSLTMKNGTDLQGYRYDAIELFLSVLTNEGNKVGAIVFNDQEKMPLDTGLKALSSMAEKKELATKIEETGARGDTDIGRALQKALEELQGGEATADLPSCIVLFSDGETDLGNAADTQASLQKKEQAIKEAKKLGIPIHGICLNTNNSANTQEVKGIADGTGGLYLEINDASDLDQAFLEFYSLIYGEEIGEEVLECPVEKKFKIPSKGVAEVNILLESASANKKITLIRPDGIAYTDAELSATSISTGKYEVIKLVKPTAGVWTLKVDGAPGAKIKIDWIYNTDLGAEVECDSENASLNTDIQIRGYLLSQNQRMDSEEVYSEYAGTLMLTNLGTGEQTNYPMTKDGASFVATVKFPEYGTYSAAIQLACGDIIHTSDPTPINVGNSAPVASQSTIEEKITILPFKKAKATFDIDDYVSDPEGDELTYTLGSYTYDVDNVELSDSKLKVNAGKDKTGSVIIIAMDSQGATCEIMFNIKTSNLTPLIIAIIILIILAVLAVILFKKHKEMTSVNPWTITVSSFDNNSGMSSEPYPQTGIRYKRNIRDWQIIDCGIQGDFISVYVKGKKHGDLKFVSNQPFETEAGMLVKEHKFTIGDDIKLFAASSSAEERMTKGVRVIVTDSMDW